MQFYAIKAPHTGAARRRRTRRIRACLLAFLAFFATALTAWSSAESGETIPVEVVKVKDGDSIVVMARGRETEVRLYGIDTPEWQQPYSRKATETLRRLLAGRAVRIKPMDTDHYGRIVAVVYADGINVDEALVKAGLAWVYSRYCDAPFCEDWKRSEERARRARLGLWQGPAPIPPWTYREEQRRQKEQRETRTFGGNYSGNIKSRRFHRASCRNFHCKNCTRFFNSRGEALEAGFVPCGGCRP